jgi:hypothetical protein
MSGCQAFFGASIQIIKPPLRQDEGALVVPPAFTFRKKPIQLGNQKVLLLALTGVPDPLYDEETLSLQGRPAYQKPAEWISCLGLLPRITGSSLKRKELLGSALVFCDPNVGEIIPEEEGMSRPRLHGCCLKNYELH